MDDQPETRARPRRGPLEHLEVAVGVAERGDGPPADHLVNADRFTGVVIDEVDGWQAAQHRLAVSDGVLDLDPAADDLLRWDAVDALDPGPHELDAAARHDVGLE